MSHPNAITLEAFACGESNAHIATHLETCTLCQDYVTKAQGLRMSRRTPQRTARSHVWWIVAVPAAAAALFLLLRPQADELRTGIRVPASVVVAEATHEEETTPIRFKGESLQIAVVRDRGGQQARFTDVVKTRPGDRLRLEVAIDSSQAILGGVLGDDGSWLEMTTDGVREVGTFFSEKSTRIDGEPTSGIVLVGPPDDVRRAKKDHLFAGLKTVRIEIEAK